MSENDYIAEYIKEKYPRLLGVDFLIWKFGRAIQTMVQEIVDIFEGMTPEEREEALREAADESLEGEEGQNGIFRLHFL